MCTLEDLEKGTSQGPTAAGDHEAERGTEQEVQRVRAEKPAEETTASPGPRSVNEL